MGKINLIIKRKSSLFAMALPYNIKIDGVKVDSILNNKEKTIEIDDKQCVLSVEMALNSLNFHKVRKDQVLFPSYCKNGEIKCEITTKPNPLGFFSMGLLAPSIKLSLNIKYV